MSLDVIFAGLVSAVLAGVAGGSSSLRSILRLDPAEAMRPPAPPDFRHGIMDRLGLPQVLGARFRIGLRLLTGRPVRTFLGVTGMSFAVMIMIVGLFWMDAIDYMLDLQFNFLDRSSATIALDRPLPERSLEEIAALPGVMRAEGYRGIPVRIFAGSRSKTTAIMGLSSESRLRRVLDKEYRPLAIPPSGLLMNKGMAERLGVRPGAQIHFQLLEKDRRLFRVPLVATVEELLGSGVYMEESELKRLLDEEGLINSVAVSLDKGEETLFLERVRQYPGMASVIMRSTSLALFQENMERMIVTMITVLVMLASAIAIGIVYNTATVTLSEQIREFGTLRVLGFHRREVFEIFLFELLALLFLSLPLGAILGYYSSLGMLSLVPTEAFSVPLVISGQTYAYAFLVEIGSVGITLVLVWYKIKHMDFLSVLKLRE